MTYSALRGFKRCAAVGWIAAVASCMPATLPVDVASRASERSSTEPVVSTRAGKLRGATEGAVSVFRGVPYGASTAGAQRFKAPKAKEPWGDVRNATRFGPICPQQGDVARGQPENSPVGFIPALPQSEDCLVLNVWTPALDSVARPVMVWFHGRGFSEGAGSEKWYDGAALAESGNVVVITVNHRLNVLGYLDLSELGGKDYASSGVAGMLDAVLALEWVRNNARAFGADPGNVTIFGESGGGAKVSTLLAMPAAKGLFHRAIIQSGAGVRAEERSSATATAKRLLDQLKIAPSELAKLQDVPYEQLVGALRSGAPTAAAPGTAAPGPQLRPVVGSADLPEHPFDPVAAPSAAGIPVLIGANKDEAALFLARDPQRGKLSDADLEARLFPVLGDNTKRILGVYRTTRPNATPWDLLVAVSTERTRLASIQLAERQGKQAPVYMYSFDWETDYLDGSLKAAHTMEIGFVFNHPDLVPLTGKRSGRAELARQVSQAWIAFARTGNPNHSGIPEWQPYTTERRSTMVFDSATHVTDDLRREERLAWEGIGPRRF